MKGAVIGRTVTETRLWTVTVMVERWGREREEHEREGGNGRTGLVMEWG